MFTDIADVIDMELEPPFWVPMLLIVAGNTLAGVLFCRLSSLWWWLPWATGLVTMIFIAWITAIRAGWDE
jgi:hypothetical protein